MGEWKAECYRDGRFLRKAVLENGPEPVELELEVEEWLKKNGIPGKAVAHIRWMRDRKVHYVVRLRRDGEIVLSNTAHAKWPMFIPGEGNDQEIPDDESTAGSDGDDEEPDESEGGEMLRRVFGRFFDGRRWRKAAIGDPEKDWQRQRVEFGLIDEHEAEIHGESSRRARQRQVQVVFSRFKPEGMSVVNVSFPFDVEPELRNGRLTLRIPDDARR